MMDATMVLQRVAMETSGPRSLGLQRGRNQVRLHPSLSSLCGCPYLALRDVDCELSGKKMIMRGTVSSYYWKQVAQESLRSYCVGLEIINSVQVVDRLG